MTPVHPRIMIEADKRDGKPCIRGMRITVNDVLGWLAHGMTGEEILKEHPGLEKEDFAAVHAFPRTWLTPPTAIGRQCESFLIRTSLRN